MKRIIGVLLIIILIATFSGCYYDKEELVYPRTQCDTANMSYTTNIESIIQTNCYVCHGGTAAGSFGVHLDSYGALHDKATTGQLLQRITSTDPSIMMPKGGPRLSDCDIAKITAWINRGSPN